VENWKPKGKINFFLHSREGFGEKPTIQVEKQTKSGTVIRKEKHWKRELQKI